MLAFQRTRRTREHTGPTPHSVAIRAKMPSKNLPEQLILERRKKEDLRDEAVQITKYNKMFDLKNDWERTTDRLIQKNTIKRKVKDLMDQTGLHLEARKLRLREMLAKEEEEYLQEMEAKQETIIERQAKMRERAKSLKEKREAERQLIVQEKLDQQWRAQCEELRSVLSRRHQDEVCVDRMQQLAIKAEMEYKRQEEERMYAELWEKDRLMKASREEQEAQEQIERNRGMVKTLAIQIAALEAKNQEEKRLVAEEAKLLIEERNLRQLEEERAKQLKHDEQRRHRASLENSIKIKVRRVAQERQEELALDMKILEQLLEESQNEVEEQTQKKLQLREENQRYRKYLQEQMEEDARKEAELDRLVDEDVERMWKKKIAQWKLEREARNRLMQDVMLTRKQQLQEKMDILGKEREELRKDREGLTNAIAAHKQLEEERVARTKAFHKQYEGDLLGQIRHQEGERQRIKEEEAREYQEGLVTEAQYQNKLKSVLSSPQRLGRVHPLRLRRPEQPTMEITGTGFK